MKDCYLEVTYRRGRALGAYYYLHRESDQRSVRTRRVEPGLVIDYAADNSPIGIEITAPSKLSVEALNVVLHDLGYPDVSQADLAPLQAA